MKSVGIIGGGINGLFSAYYLLENGSEVTVFDCGDFSDGCSHGNAGMIVPSHIIPLAQPGMMAKGLRWMLSAESPFYVKPRLDRDLAKWGYLFWKHATTQHVQRAIPVLRDLSLLSKQLFQDVAAHGGFAFGWEEKGLFMLFKNADTRHEMQEEAAVANRAGIDAHLLSGREVQAMEPTVRVEVEGAVYYPGDAHINPNQLMTGMVAHLKARGVRFLGSQSVEDFELAGKSVKSITTREGSYTFDEVVVAAGAWSPILARKLGISLPLQGGKGYSFVAENTAGTLRTPAIMLEARATATPMRGGVRFAGTLEVAGTDTSVNMSRVRGIHTSIREYYPELTVKFPDQEAVWRGLRPCSPDGLPYIGRVGHFSNVILATGHGMMGVSLGPATGKLVAELVGGQEPSVGIAAFSPLRFN